MSTSIVAGLVGTVTQAQRAEAEARHAATEALSAKQERDMALQQLSYAESSNEFISFLLQEGAEKSFTTSELLNRGEQLVDHQFSDDAAQRAQPLDQAHAVEGADLVQHDQALLALKGQRDAKARRPRGRGSRRPAPPRA